MHRHLICTIAAVVVLAGCRETPAPPSSPRADSTAASAEPASPAGDVSSVPDSVLVYEFVYPYNTATLVENHYIELSMHGASVRGRYYGTTDDFDSAREGYLPGFFATTMNDLRIDGGTISFTLAPWDYYTAPRTPGMDPDASTTDETRWKGPQLASSRSYRGVVTQDSIILESPFGPRAFGRAPREPVPRP